jgi:hypothetical protein
MSSPDQTNEDRAEAAPSTGESPETPPRGRGRDQRFRARLLEKLPKLGFASWSANEDFKVDEEWSGIVSLGSDAVLGPLEPLAPERRGA